MRIQIATAESKASARDAVDLSPAEHARLVRAGTLQLARLRVLQQLQGACDRRYRAQLEQSLADIDAQLGRAGVTDLSAR